MKTVIFINAKKIDRYRFSTKITLKISIIKENEMFTLDHIMIETDCPQKMAKEFSEIFELPYAWPFSESEDYASVGINSGKLILSLLSLNFVLES